MLFEDAVSLGFARQSHADLVDRDIKPPEPEDQPSHRHLVEPVGAISGLGVNSG